MAREHMWKVSASRNGGTEAVGSASPSKVLNGSERGMDNPPSPKTKMLANFGKTSFSVT